MHCPRCGQKQVSAEVHFCKSCGLPLDRVKGLLAGDEVSPVLDQGSQKPGESPRRKGVRQGVKLIFICLVLAVLTSRIGGRRGDFLPLMFFMAGMVRILYAVIFQGGASRKKKHEDSTPSAPIRTERLRTATRGHALYVSRGVPVAAFITPRVYTSEMAGPPSVTEHTTKLLNES
jgi:hypothetical protein